MFPKRSSMEANQSTRERNEFCGLQRGIKDMEGKSRRRAYVEFCQGKFIHDCGSGVKSLSWNRRVAGLNPSSSCLSLCVLGQDISVLHPFGFSQTGLLRCNHLYTWRRGVGRRQFSGALVLEMFPSLNRRCWSIRKLLIHQQLEAGPVCFIIP